jgi:hypothetical protein
VPSNKVFSGHYECMCRLKEGGIPATPAKALFGNRVRLISLLKSTISVCTEYVGVFRWDRLSFPPKSLF